MIMILSPCINLRLASLYIYLAFSVVGWPARYRSEMRFVAATVGLQDWADLLHDHSGILQVEEF